MDPSVMEGQFFNSIKILILQRFVKSSKTANQNDCTNEISSDDCSNRKAPNIKQVQNYLNNRESNNWTKFTIFLKSKVFCSKRKNIEIMVQWHFQFDMKKTCGWTQLCSVERWMELAAVVVEAWILFSMVQSKLTGACHHQVPRKETAAFVKMLNGW